MNVESSEDNEMDNILSHKDKKVSVLGVTKDEDIFKTLEEAKQHKELNKRQKKLKEKEDLRIQKEQEKEVQRIFKEAEKEEKKKKLEIEREKRHRERESKTENLRQAKELIEKEEPVTKKRKTRGKLSTVLQNYESESDNSVLEFSNKKDKKLKDSED